MAGVQPHGLPVALQPLLKVLIGKVLMPRQRVGVCEGGIQLQSPLEELESILVFLHQHVTSVTALSADTACKSVLTAGMQGPGNPIAEPGVRT